MKWKQVSILAVVFATSVALFQNCSLPSQPVAFSESKAFASEGNGHGYDGKVYLITGKACADTTLVHSKIILKSESTGSLVRENCQDIAPIAIGPADFSIDPTNVDQLQFRNQLFGAQVPMNAFVLNKAAFLIPTYGGAAYLIHSQDFGGIADNDFVRVQSKMQLYENGVAMGPAHSAHSLIASEGLGRFSHWSDGIQQAIYFSATDNSNPMSNGRVYSFKFLP